MEAGQIIIINGTSSSGKTSILHAFQNTQAEVYLECGIDTFIWMMPERYRERPLWEDVLGQANKAGYAGHQLVKGMHQAIRSLSLAGINVIADHIMIEFEWARECARLLADLPAYIVGVHCPLDIVEAREASRKNRTLGQARLQNPIIHKFTQYDVVVETSRFDPEECTQQIQLCMMKPPVGLRKML